ncbi:MAG: CPBP family intramembrane metalloprotease [Ruminococcus sp.]|nr:CPBP family intramembrane metalloprotease [Ruminococcus sp.]
MEDNKLIRKQIRRASNTTALPLLIYIALYILFISFMPQLITKPLQSLGIGLTDRSEIFIKYLLIYFVILPLGMLSLRLTQRKDKDIRLAHGFRKPEKSIGWCLKWIIIAIGASTMLAAVPTLIATVLQLILDTSASPTQNLFTIQTMSVIAVPKWIGATFPTLIFAPIIEELLFRGLIFPHNRKLGELFAIIISGVFFGLWHQNLPQIFVTATFGMFSAFLYLRTKSIYPSIIAHFLNNSIAVLRDFLASRINTDGFSVDPVHALLDNLGPILLFLLYSFVMGSVIVMGLVFFIIELVKKKELKFERSELDLPLCQKLLVYFTSPLTLTVTLYLIIIAILNTVNGYYWFLN